MEVHKEHKKKGPDVVKIALIVVSTTRYNELIDGKPSTDKTIPAVKQILLNHPEISLSVVEIIADDANQIKNALNNLLDYSTLNAIIFSGGTGLTPKDITYDIIHPQLEKEITGFGELFRYLSYKEIGAAAMLSRASAGKIKDKAVILLPGSPKAVELAFNKLIIPELKHMVYMINKEE